MASVHRTVDCCDWPNCSCRNCSRISRMSHSNARCPVSDAHSVRHCRNLWRKSCRRTGDRIQCWRACESSRIALADAWFADCRSALPMATDRPTPHCGSNAPQFVAVLHRLAIVTLAARKRLYAPAVMQMSQLMVHHFLHSVNRREKNRVENRIKFVRGKLNCAESVTIKRP